MPDKIEVVTSKRWWRDPKWWWRKRAANGEIVSHAEDFESHQGAQNAANREAAPRVEKLEVVEVEE